jgi:hypothetical protein
MARAAHPGGTMRNTIIVGDIREVARRLAAVQRRLFVE